MIDIAPIQWLGSYPKSGNTFVRLLLNAYVFGFLDINSNVNICTYDGETYLYNALSPLPLTEMSVEVVAYLRYTALLHHMVANRYRPVLVKTHSADIIVGDVRMIPHHLSGPSVYLVRDPRDVAPSHAKHTGKTVDAVIDSMNNPNYCIEVEGMHIGAWLNTWSYHVKSWAEREDTKVVRFEDLCSDTETVFSDILAHYGFKVDRAKVKKAVNLCRLERLQKQESKRGFIECGKQERFFGSGQGWRKELNVGQIKRIEADHGEVMQGYGYAPFWAKDGYARGEGVAIAAATEE